MSNVIIETLKAKAHVLRSQKEVAQYELQALQKKVAVQESYLRGLVIPLAEIEGHISALQAQEEKAEPDSPV